MAEILTTPYLIGESKLEIGADGYTSALSAAELVPTTPKATFRDIGGGIKTIAGTPAWKFNLGKAQDWGPDSSLSHYLRLHHGEAVQAKLTPIAGGRAVSFTFVCEASNIGGAAAGVASSTLSLDVDGQPVWDPAGA